MAASRLSGSGSGSGSGYGYGFGYGDGYGYGSSCGDGSGYGYGYGYGDGSGYGDGYGGYGDGYGDKIGTVGGHDVLALSPWPVVRVGCEVRSAATWLAEWREIAERHGVNVTEEEVEALLAAALAPHGGKE